MRGDHDECGDRGGAWRSQFPTVSDYIDSLPDGWASFPECTASTVLLAAIRARDPFQLSPALPEPIRWFSEPDTREWILEVHHVATMLAVHDAAFAGDREAFLQWAVEMSSARTASNAALLGPTEDMLRVAPQVWTVTHRGTSLHLVSLEPGAARSELRYPAPIFPPVIIEYFARIFAITLVRTDAAQPEVSWTTSEKDGQGVAAFTAHWRS